MIASPNYNYYYHFAVYLQTFPMYTIFYTKIASSDVSGN